MIVEIFLLALASTVRPTSLAAVYALLSHRSRRVLLSAYVAGGLVFTILFGLIVVYVLHGIHLRSGSDQTKAAVDLAGGAAAVLFGFAVLTGRVHATRTDDAPAVTNRWASKLERRLTLRTAALAGPATHIPGVFYLIALNAIVGHELRLVRGALAVTIYNAIWFAIPILALVLCIVRPDAARDAVGAVEHWARRHARTIMLVASFGVGTALIVRGALTI